MRLFSRWFSICGAVILSAVTLQADAGVTAATAFDRSYTIYRNGTEIGTRTAHFSLNGGGFEVVQETNIAVKLVFITAFKREEKLHEIWENGELTRFTSHVSNDGERFEVQAARTESGALHVTGTNGTYQAPGGALPATYWHESIAETNSLIHVMRGTLQQVQTTRVGEETLSRGEKTLKTTRYRMTGDERADLWFDAHGVTVRVIYHNHDGDRIEVHATDLSNTPIDLFHASN